MPLFVVILSLSAALPLFRSNDDHYSRFSLFKDIYSRKQCHSAAGTTPNSLAAGKREQEKSPLADEQIFHIKSLNISI